MNHELGGTAAPAAPGGTPSASSAPPMPERRPRRLGLELGVIGVVAVLLFAALAAGGVTLYRELYSPTAFVLRYLDLLSDGRAADALAVPGVALDAAGLEAEGLSATASNALLRSAALSSLTDVVGVSEEASGDSTRVTVEYVAGGHRGTSTFEVAQDGWIGVVPSWTFAKSPLAVMDLVVTGSMRFAVNGFEVDKRQVSANGVDADPLAAVPLLVFSPGIYSVDVDTQISTTPGVAVLADLPTAGIPVRIQAEATTEFVDVVQQRVEEFLADCATQQVLQPTGCPFGLTVQNRIISLPAWSIVQHPAISVTPDGAGWSIAQADAVARVEVQIRSLYDGSVRTVSEDVPFVINGSVEVLPDGTASIKVGGNRTS
ncbi:hypothetical protein [Microbacterium sp. AG1240]|uniref:hypothetical protein n=1 Tax=Microbacterium sp. AG1240 TaxID=2183992 RepID=UPI000EB0E89B|nr:hypothetical protein [Microbacterium sp. AG1240]